MRWMVLILMLAGCASFDDETRWRRAVGAGMMGVGAAANAYAYQRPVRTWCMRMGSDYLCRSR